MRKIAYWVTTALLALAYLAGGTFDILQPEPVAEGAKHLGYPLYFFTILGFWKLAAVIALLVPGLPRVKEWAYAGIWFNLTGAIATHLFVQDPITNVIAPFVLLALSVASWAYRPDDRKLTGPWV